METVPYWQLSTNTDKRRRPLRANQPAIQLSSAQKSKLYPLLHGHTLKTRTESCRRPRQTPLAKAKDRQYNDCRYRRTPHTK
eukprot:scaffold14593_cov139-Isochrysis_galbana.AAC.1